jgi:hypothetical protein
MSTPTLLSLPREVRDIIYAHLSQEVVVDWGYQTHPFPLGGHDILRLRVPEAPLTNVLLSCAQIYHEYSQNRFFRRPSITIDLSEHSTAHILEAVPTNHSRALRILERTSHIDYIIDRGTESNVLRYCSDIEEWSRRFEVLAPRLETLQAHCKIQNHGPLAQPTLTDTINNAVAILPSDAVAALSQRIHLHLQAGPFVCTNKSARTRMPAGIVLLGEWRIERRKTYEAAQRI